MRSDNDTHIGRDNPLAANAHNRVRFDGTQQGSLQVEWHITNFIQEQRAAVSLFKLTRTPLAISASERATFVAKEFGIDEFSRDSCTVDGHEVGRWNYYWQPGGPGAVLL